MEDSVKTINISDYIYELPDERIARHPLAERDACKLLVGDSSGVVADSIFNRLPALLPQDALLVYNNTRVINARLRFHKSTGGLIEVFCLEPVSPADYEQCFASAGPVVWECLVGNSKKWKEGILQGVLTIDGCETVLTARRISNDGKTSRIELSWNNPAATFARIIESAGEIPIPPYLNRNTEDSDLEDYQTVFSRFEGSVAAPTAGLHFTDRLLADIDAAGIERAEVTLHVGAGTFQPVKSEEIGDHLMHSEFIVVNREVIERMARGGRPVFAVGTTSVRTLESLYHIGCLVHAGAWDGHVPQWYPYAENHPNLTVAESMQAVLGWLDERGLPKLIADTRIIIAPGYEYRIVEGMVTNFHQPGSTLLLLVSAFIGEAWRDLYSYAMSHDYRFLSYGDACLLLK